MGMEGTSTQVSGGGTISNIADLPSDWRRQVDDELRNALKDLDVVDEVDLDGGEFTANDVIGLWVPTLQGTTRRLKMLVAEGSVTTRKAYDPRISRQVNAYKKV